MKTITLLSAFFSLCLVIVLFTCTKKPAWQPAKGPLMTRWAKDVSAQNVLPDYPRPQLVRREWQNLNGLWDYAIVKKDSPPPQNFQGKILVPFAAEAALSGVMKAVGAENELWYRKTITVDPAWRQNGRRLFLHFGAVDWETTLWINGQQAGSHRGGYDAFSFDISDVLKEGNEQQILIRVWDPVEKGTQPRGKQVSRPHGIWYTSVTGIWQTVWLEPLNPVHITSLKTTADIRRKTLTVNLQLSAARPDLTVEATLSFAGQTVDQISVKNDTSLVFELPEIHLWQPDEPNLYDLNLQLSDGQGDLLDQVQSYAGMRTISLGKDKNGLTRLMLNDQFVFQLGPLDQGWWPDGLYTAPTDEALRYDIETTKKLGFNMARKHVKVEPARWYYWCDRLGLLVWQDMPSGDKYIGRDDPDLIRSAQSAAQFETELGQLISERGIHPCIIIWVPFNEGWGQYDTPRIVDKIKHLDPTRLVIDASGWTDRGVGDIHDIHAYPGPAMPDPEAQRAIVLGEFGGLGLPLEGHTWQSADNWGYRNYQNAAELTEAYSGLLRNLQPLISKGLSAAVYTQTSDVEVEVNGLMTYDRARVKMDTAVVRRINEGYLPPLISAAHSLFTSSLTVTISNVRQQGVIHYTLDGSVPGKESPVYSRPLSLHETTLVRACTVFEDGSSSAAAEKQFEKVSLSPAMPVSNLQPGLSYAYYELANENIEALPDFDSLLQKTGGMTRTFSLDMARREEFFGLRFNGYIRIPADGIYTFYLDSDDGSRLLIDDRLVVDNDGTHGMLEKSGEAALAAGMHALQLLFFQGRGAGSGGKGLRVSIRGPRMEKQPLPAGLLFFK